MKDPMIYIDRFCRKHPNFGIQNLMIVETDDAILVAQRGRSQDVKKLVQRMREQGRKELE